MGRDRKRALFLQSSSIAIRPSLLYPRQPESSTFATRPYPEWHPTTRTNYTQPCSSVYPMTTLPPFPGNKTTSNWPSKAGSKLVSWTSDFFTNPSLLPTRRPVYRAIFLFRKNTTRPYLGVKHDRRHSIGKCHQSQPCPGLRRI